MSSDWSAIEDIELELAPIGEGARPQLCEMLAAGEEIQECYRVLKKGGSNIVAEVLKGQGKFYQLDHYPKGDVYDRETHSQYFYHAHRGLPGENGHFHTFIRGDGIPVHVRPVAYDGDQAWPEGDAKIAHLVAVSMDRYGFPIGLFGVNRWVTDEAWHAAPDVIGLLPGFDIDHAVPSWPTNRWLSAMLRLFRPHAEALLRQRDRVTAKWAQLHPERDVYEDRKLEVTGWVRISVNKQVEAVRAALGGSGVRNDQ